MLLLFSSSKHGLFGCFLFLFLSRTTGWTACKQVARCRPVSLSLAAAAVMNDATKQRLLERKYILEDGTELVKDVIQELSHQNSLDLLQEGLLALMLAMERYKKQQQQQQQQQYNNDDVAFEEYVRHSVCVAIQRAIHRNAGLVSLPRVLLARAEQARRDLSIEYTRTPTHREVAARLGVSPLLLTRCQQAARNTLSVETQQQTTDPHNHPMQNVLPQYIRAIVQDTLEPTEASVIYMIYGMGTNTPSNTTEIAKTLGISHKQVETMEARAMTKLRKALRDENQKT